MLPDPCANTRQDHPIRQRVLRTMLPLLAQLNPLAALTPQDRPIALDIRVNGAAWLPRALVSARGRRAGLLLARGVPPRALAVGALARLGWLAALLRRLARAAPRLPCDPLVTAPLAPVPRHLDRDLRHALTVALGIYVRKNTSTSIPN